jgi:hypothetical protein
MIVDRIHRVAHSRFWQWPGCRLNQISWYSLMYASEPPPLYSFDPDANARPGGVLAVSSNPDPGPTIAVEVASGARRRHAAFAVRIVVTQGATGTYARRSLTGASARGSAVARR